MVRIHHLTKRYRTVAGAATITLITVGGKRL